MIPAFRKLSNRWLLLTALAALAALVAFQAWAYSTRLQLSLGPRVILQPWLLHRGFLMYENAADLHTPLMPLILAALDSLIPDGLERAQLVLVALLSLTTVLVFAASLRRAGLWIGLLGAAFFVLWSPAFGFGKLWYESFLAPLYLVWLLLYDPSGRPPLARSQLLMGLLGGVAIMLKQHAAIVFASFVVWNAWIGWHAHHSLRRSLREVTLIGVAAAFPVAAYLAYQFVQAHTLQGFVYWILAYPLAGVFGELAAQPPTPAQIRTLLLSAIVLPVTVGCLVHAIHKGDKAWMHLGGSLTLLIASCITAYPRFSMFHLQGALPLLAVVTALTVNYLRRSLPVVRIGTGIVLLALSLLWLQAVGRTYPRAILQETPRMITEYSALVPLADEIRQAIGPSACVYIFPETENNSNLYFLLGCPPPRYWVFHYPWYMIEPIKSWALHALQEAAPEWVIYFPNDWRQSVDLAPEIIDYIHHHYQEGVTLSQGQVLLHKIGP